jgi:hypothetical protein
VSPYTILIAERLLATVRSYSQDDRREIARLLRLIEMDPSIDGRAKLPLMRSAGFYTVYASARFWIVYHVNGNVIVVTAVGRAGLPEPTP